MDRANWGSGGRPNSGAQWTVRSAFASTLFRGNDFDMTPNHQGGWCIVRKLSKCEKEREIEINKEKQRDTQRERERERGRYIYIYIYIYM